MKFQQIHIRLDEETYNKVVVLAKHNNESISQTIRDLIKKGLAVEHAVENIDIIASTVRQQMDNVLKPHVERLAKISAKAGHMSATATFLNVQAFMDLVPDEKRKDVRVLYEKARKKAAEYMKIPTDEFYSLIK